MTSLFPYLPAFLDLAGKPAVLLSGDASMAGLARRLIEAGAGVTIYDREPSEPVTALRARLRIALRRWRASDMYGAAFVAAPAHEPRRLRARIAAKAARAIFYMEGRPDVSDLAFGAAEGHGRLAIGVAGQGVPAALQDAVARRLQAALPPAYAGFLEAAAAAERAVEQRLTDPLARAAFWRAAAEDAFAASPSDWPAWLHARLDS